MISDPQPLIFEFVAIQLILRSVGIKTSEMEVVLNVHDKKNTSLDLALNQNGLIDTLHIGVLKLPLIKVQQFWESWLESASKQILKNFDKYKLKLKAFRTMETMLEHLEQLGFALSDAPISQTNN